MCHYATFSPKASAYQAHSSWQAGRQAARKQSLFNPSIRKCFVNSVQQREAGRSIRSSWKEITTNNKQTAAPAHVFVDRGRRVAQFIAVALSFLLFIPFLYFVLLFIALSIALLFSYILLYCMVMVLLQVSARFCGFPSKQFLSFS